MGFGVFDWPARGVVFNRLSCRIKDGELIPVSRVNFLLARNRDPENLTSMIICGFERSQ